jgi:hypothetical protein
MLFTRGSRIIPFEAFPGRAIQRAGPKISLSLTRFGGQVVKTLVPSVRRVFLFYFVVVVSLWELWNRRFHSIHSTSSFDVRESRDQRACLKIADCVLGCRLFLIALEVIRAAISQRRVETL